MNLLGSRDGVSNQGLVSVNMTVQHKKVILLEFNELTPSLMNKFIDDGKLPNFKKFRSESEVYETMATEVSPDLEPWIQWVTLHTGLDYCDHKVFHLNEGHKLSAPRIWDCVSKHGMKSWVCGSMNVNAEPGFNGLLLPDPWCTEVPASDGLKLFFNFIQKNVLEYSNDRIPLTKKQYLDVIMFLATHGISLDTVSSIFKQLLEDRGGRFKWKRAVLLEKLQFDVFRWFWLREKPNLSTFFANSTAHFQHSYWRNMDPDRFEVAPTNPKPDEYENAIVFGYMQMDQLLGKFMKLADRDTTLIFSTAISQQPCLKYEATGGAFFHRSKDFTKFLNFANIVGYGGVAPVMTHQFHVDFESDQLAEKSAEILRSFTYGDQPLLQVELKGSRVFAGCRIYRAIDLSKNIHSKTLNKEAPMSQFFYRMDTNKSGMHHPLGMLWVKNGSNQGPSNPNDAKRIPLRSAPNIILAPLALQM
jgi:hypothetical protein